MMEKKREKVLNWENSHERPLRSDQQLGRSIKNFYIKATLCNFFLNLTKKLQNHFDGSVSYNRMNGVSVTEITCFFIM